MRYAFEPSPESASRVADAAARRAAPRGDRWLAWASLGIVAFGIIVAVALLQYHFAYGETRPTTGPVVWMHAGLGFVPALLGSLLLLFWGGVAFVTGGLREPARRVAASVLFVFCAAVLTSALGGHGGRAGDVVAARLVHAFGAVFVSLLLSGMTVTALLLATNWFFLRTFLRLARRVDGTRDPGLEPSEEEGLAIEAAVRSRRSRLGLVPVPSSEQLLDAVSAERMREQELMDRVLEEARRDLVAGKVPAGAATPAGDDEVCVLGDPDPFAELDDEDLLEKAGEVLDRVWAEAEEPAPPAEEPGVEAPSEAAGDAAQPVQETLFAEEPPDPDVLDRAARVILTARRPMPSLLQRRLGLSFAEARQTLDYLARLGAVEAPSGGGPWMPLIGVAEWEERRA